MLVTNRVSADRILAKATYPNGTDSTFLADWCRTWADVEALSQRAEEAES